VGSKTLDPEDAQPFDTTHLESIIEADKTFSTLRWDKDPATAIRLHHGVRANQGDPERAGMLSRIVAFRRPPPLATRGTARR